MNRDADVIELIDLRASGLSGSTRAWMAALAIAVPAIAGYFAARFWVGTQLEATRTHLALLLQVGLATLAGVCFIDLYSRGVQRHREVARRTSLAFLFLACAFAGTAFRTMADTGVVTSGTDDLARLNVLAINLGASIILLFPSLGKKPKQNTQRTVSMVRPGLLVVMAGLALPSLCGQLHAVDAVAATLIFTSVLSLPIFLWVAIHQSCWFLESLGPMRLTTAVVATGGFTSQLILLAASPGEYTSFTLAAEAVLACTLLSPLTVLVAKDIVSVRRSLPAQVRLAFNGIIAVVIAGATCVISQCFDQLRFSQGSQAVLAELEMQERTFILMMMATIAGICAAMLGATRRLRGFLNNVEGLVSATRELSQGRYGQLIHENSEDELGVLNVAFNAMTERLFAQNRELRILAHVMDGTSDPVVVVNPGGHIIYTNRAFTRKTGWERGRVIGAPYSSLFSEGTSRRRLNQILEGQHPESSSAHELNIDIRGGGRLASLVTVSPVENNGRTIYHVVVHHDIGPVKELEAERERFTQSLLDVHSITRSVVECLDLREVQRRALIGLEVTFGIKGRIWQKGAAHSCSSCPHNEVCHNENECLHLFGTNAAGLLCHPAHHGLLGRAISTSTNQICKNPANEPELFRFMPKEHLLPIGVRVAFPLVAGGIAMGVLEVSLPENRLKERIDVLEILVQILAESMFNARNHERLSRQASQMREMTDDLEAAVEIEKTQARELRRLNDRLLEADQVKSNFLSNTSHELRSPLSGIMGYLQLIVDGIAEDHDEEMEFVRGAHDQAEALLEIINNVLDLAKIDAGKATLSCEELDIEMLFSEAEAGSSRAAAQKGLALEFEQVQPGTVVHADYIRMAQVFSIVIGNSIKFTDEGTIRVSARPVPGCNLVEFRVEDQGIGIAPEDQSRVLEAFVQADGSDSRRFGGSGLGLTLARDLLSMMGGTLCIRSEGVGLGSTVHFTLPTAAPTQQTYGEESPERQVALVVDSDPTFIETAKDALCPLGICIVVVPTAAEAFERIHQLEPDWVLSELVLPHSNHPRLRTGRDLGRAVKTLETQDPAFLLASGHPGARDATTDDGSGIELIEKPVAPTTILDELGLLDRQAAFMMKPQILVVDATPDAPERFMEALGHLPFAISFSNNADAASHQLRQPSLRTNLLVIDLSIPGSALFELLAIARERLRSETIGLILLQNEHGATDREAAILKEHEKRVAVVPSNMVDTAPHAFVNCIVNVLAETAAAKKHLVSR